MEEILTSRVSTEGYLALRESVNWAVYDYESADKALNNSLFMVSIKLNGKTIAFGRVIGDGYITFYIQDIMVLPKFRRKGYATRIMAAIIEYIEATAAKNAVVGLMSAKGVEPLYEKFGFKKRPCGELLGYGMTR